MKLMMCAQHSHVRCHVTWAGTVPRGVAPPSAGVPRRGLVHVAAAAADGARRALGGGPVLRERPRAHVVVAAGPGLATGAGEVVVAGAAVGRA